MTLGELSQLYYLKNEIEADKQRLAELRDKVYALAGPNMDGMPRGSGGKSKVDKYIADIIELESLIESKINRSIYERTVLENYISKIRDSLTRQIFTYRFVHNMSWAQVAAKLGGYNTVDGVKKICYRYINKH